MYFGRPSSAPCSMKSKSKTKDSEAKQTMTRERPMLINEPLVGERRLMPLPKKLIMKLTM